MLKEVTNSIYFDYYGDRLFLIESVTEKLLERIEDIEKRRKEKGERRLSDSVRYRIKSPESIKKKLAGRGFEEDICSAMENIYDMSGIRIICPYIDDVYRMAEEISRCSDIEVVLVKDYIKNPKENGYRSYHMIVKTPVRLDGETKYGYSEIQIRTMVMNSWASAEHSLRYKSEKRRENEQLELLKKCADEMLKIDYSMMKIRDMMES